MNAVTDNTALVERKEPPKDFPAMLTAWLPEIQRALPKHISAERMARIALTCFRRNPKLGECDPRSVFAGVLQSAQLGLEIDILGRAYLVPYKKNTKTARGWESTMECQFIPGWKGLVDLMNRSGQGSAWTGAAFEGDEFLWELGDSPRIRHRPAGENDPKKLTHVYAVGRVKGSDWPIIEVWPITKIWKHRDHYNKVGDKHYSYENPEMYARKVPLLQVLKYMPCSIELTQAIALSEAGESGAQNLTIKNVIEQSWDDREVVVDEQHPAGNGSRTSSVKEALKATAAGAKTVQDFKVKIEDIITDIKGARTVEIAQLALDLANECTAEERARAKVIFDETWPAGGQA